MPNRILEKNEIENQTVTHNAGNDSSGGKSELHDVYVIHQYMQPNLTSVKFQTSLNHHKKLQSVPFNEEALQKGSSMEAQKRYIQKKDHSKIARNSQSRNSRLISSSNGRNTVNKSRKTISPNHYIAH